MKFRIVQVPRGLLVGVFIAFVAASGCQQAARPHHSSALSPGPDAKVGPREEANVRFAIGRAAEQRGDLQDALAAYTAALKHDPKRAEVLQRMGVVHDRMGHYNESAVYYQKAIAASPGNPEILCDKGYGLYLQRRFAEAETCFKQAAALRPDFQRAYVNLGLVQARSGKTQEALMSFRKGGCSLSQAHQNVAFVMTTERKFDDAKKEYLLAIAVEPNSAPLQDRVKQLDRIVAAAVPAKAVADPAVARVSGTK